MQGDAKDALTKASLQLVLLFLNGRIHIKD